MNNVKNLFKVERRGDSIHYSLTNKPSIDEAKSWIGSAEHWRITEIETGEEIASSGELPEIFDRNLLDTSNPFINSQNVFKGRR